MRRALLFVPLVASAQDSIRKETGQATEIPYDAYSVTDRFGRGIRFFITKEESKKLPLVVSILGSGSDSNFLKRGGRVLDGHRVLREVFKDRARVLIVEKPGLQFGEHPARPGTSEGSTEEFRREYTLDRWSEAVSAAVRAARTLPVVETERTLVLGHSEGGLVACRVAAMNPFVTHVASLAGGGPTRLFTILELCRSGVLYQDVSDVPEQRVQKFVADWRDVLSDPDSTSKFFLGHPYRTWVSFARSSCVAELSHSTARVYVAHGTEDHNVAPAAADVLYSELLVIGSDNPIGGTVASICVNAMGNESSSNECEPGSWELPKLSENFP